MRHPGWVRTSGGFFRENEGMRLTQAVQEFLRTAEFEYGYSEHTLRAYRRDLEGLVGFVAGEENPGASVEAVTLDSLREWLWQEQQRGLAASTIARRVASTKSFGAWLE